MKKLFQTIFMSALSILLFAMPAFAATQEPKEIPVVVRCLCESDAITAAAENGQATAELEPGTTLTVTGLPGQGGLTLVVYPIPAGDTQAWSWFANCMAPYGTKLYPLDIYFEDSDGNRVELDVTITITIETLRDYTDPIVCYVATDGTVEVLDSRVEGDAITFTTNHNSYYVLAERAVKPTPGLTATPASGGGSDSSSTGSAAAGTATAAVPQTGDEGNMVLWLGLLVVSGLALGGITLYRRKKTQ